MTPNLFGLTDAEYLKLIDALIAMYPEAVKARVAEFKASQQQCAGKCGRTDNLQMGHAAGNEVWLCPVCRALEEER